MDTLLKLPLGVSDGKPKKISSKIFLTKVLFLETKASELSICQTFSSNITMTYVEELRETFPKITAAIQLEAGTLLLNTLEDALLNRQVDLALERYERFLSENPSRLYLRLFVDDLHQAVRGEGFTTAERVEQIKAIVQDIHKLRELMKKYRIPSE